VRKKGAQNEQEFVIFSMEKKRKSSFGNRNFYTSHYYQQKRVESFCDRVSDIVLRGRCCNIIVLNTK
jgi:hypothetical protein